MSSTDALVHWTDIFGLPSDALTLHIAISRTALSVPIGELYCSTAISIGGSENLNEGNLLTFVGTIMELFANF